MSKEQNIAMLGAVARRLGHLREKMVFIGGATTGLHITDPAAAEIRPTMDIDVITAVVGKQEYYRLGETLRGLGFREDTSDGAPVCRWIVEGIRVDVMPDDESVLGFANRWYAETFNTAMRRRIEGEVEVLMATPPCFLATKMEAFAGRGGGDFMTSHDMEDIIALIDGRLELAGEIEKCDIALKDYIGGTFQKYLKDGRFLECISGHLPPDRANQARVPLVIKRIRTIAALVRPSIDVPCPK